MSKDHDNKNKLSDVHMQSDKVDQVNINHQSNMTLSAHSSITQSYYSVKVNDDIIEEDIESNDKSQ
ncbi:MAG: hypothetical protein ACOYWZ_14795 [Bacillota bacterium]